MKKRNFVGLLTLLAVLVLPMVANAATTNGGYYIYSTANKSAGSYYGFIGDKNKLTPGVSWMDSTISAPSGGPTIAFDEGRGWAETYASYNPNYGTCRVENDAKDYTGWTHFRY